MASLVSHKQLSAVAELPFCYWCGRAFEPGDYTDGDHVPPRAIFANKDRSPPLKLKTHVACNRDHGVTDEKMGPLLALLHGKVPPAERQKLRFRVSHQLNIGGVTNINIEGSVWRYVRGFHAALYREPFPVPSQGTLTVPFAKVIGNDLKDSMRAPQHRLIVAAIKAHRAFGHLDRILANNGKLTYECVWLKADDGRWTCMFALGIYGWKDLGDTGTFPARGCAGMYIGKPGDPPAMATLAKQSPLIVPNIDPLDPFAC